VQAVIKPPNVVASANPQPSPVAEVRNRMRTAGMLVSTQRDTSLLAKGRRMPPALPYPWAYESVISVRITDFLDGLYRVSWTRSHRAQAVENLLIPIYVLRSLHVYLAHEPLDVNNR
jgi:hypothetical protein